MLYKNRLKIGIISFVVLLFTAIGLGTSDNKTILTEEFIETLTTNTIFNSFIGAKDIYDGSTEELTFTPSSYIDLLEANSYLTAVLEYTGNSITSNTGIIYFEFKNLETNELINVEYDEYYKDYDRYYTSGLYLPKVGNQYVMYLSECNEKTPKKVNNCYAVDSETIDITETNSVYLEEGLKVFDLTNGFKPVDLTSELPQVPLTMKYVRDMGYTFMYDYEMKYSDYTRDEYYSDYQAIYDEISARYKV